MSFAVGAAASPAPYPVHSNDASFKAPYPPPYYPTAGNAGPQISMPTSKVEIRVSCRGLPNLDLLSKSDPFVVFYTQGNSGNNKRWIERERTETIADSLDPDFVKCFVTDYHFEMIQKLRMEVYDSDSESADLGDHDFIGSCECTLGSLLGEYHGNMELELKKNETINRGKIILHAEEISDCRDELKLKFSAKKLDRKDFFGRSDPFLIFYRYNEDNSTAAVHKTEVIKNTLNPSWRTVEVPVQSLCNGDIHRPLKISCLDYNKSGNHELIGDFSTTVAELKSHIGGSFTFDVINPKKKSKKNYKNSGTVLLERVEVRTISTFLDFIRGGMELCFTVAVDFTASNGHPMSPESLHFRSGHTANQYVQALTAVGRVCEDYDTDKLFPAYGFGAKVPPHFNVEHAFPLNGTQNPDCYGVQGILDAYYRTLNCVHLYGPTNFSPVISIVSQNAAAAHRERPGRSYHVLLIITDGIITDFGQTKEAIVQASSLPLSLIIVGVGPAEFDAMEELDGDVVRVSSRGRLAERDIVQFVPYRDFANRGPGAGDALAREVLAELPEQVVSYMKAKGLTPGV